MSSRFDASRQTKKSVTGSSTPLTTWTATRRPITGTPGSSATIVPIAISVVITPTNTGASRGRRAMPFSKPKVSETT